jgi:hypothetical protein
MFLHEPRGLGLNEVNCHNNLNLYFVHGVYLGECDLYELPQKTCTRPVFKMLDTCSDLRTLVYIMLDILWYFYMALCHGYRKRMTPPRLLHLMYLKIKKHAM